jgi:hypothetical protein
MSATVLTFDAGVRVLRGRLAEHVILQRRRWLQSLSQPQTVRPPPAAPRAG